MPTAKKHQEPDDEKLGELILYLAYLSERDRNFGAVKLNKLLFYADFLAYQKFGHAITGQEYQALPKGPAPKRLKPVIERMKSSGDLKIEIERKFGFNQHRTVALRMAELHKFSGEEIDLVQNVVTRFWDLNAAQISDESHLFLGWQLGVHGETIPYSVVLIGTRKPTQREQRKGRALQKLAKEALSGSHR